MVHQAKHLSPAQRAAAELQRLFAEVDLNLVPISADEAEDIFTEAMRSSRPGYRTHE